MVRKLVGLFKAFAREEAERSQQPAAPDQAEQQPDQARRQVVDPSGVRRALHALNAKAFSVGARSLPALQLPPPEPILPPL